jgi:hypothetical protein
MLLDLAAFAEFDLLVSVPIVNSDLFEMMRVRRLPEMPFDALYSAVARCCAIRVSIPRCLGIGDPGTATPDLCPAARRKETTALEIGRPVLVGGSFPSLGRLALGTGHRQTGDRDRMASQGLSSLLDLESPLREAGPAWCFP